MLVASTAQHRSHRANDHASHKYKPSSSGYMPLSSVAVGDDERPSSTMFKPSPRPQRVLMRHEAVETVGSDEETAMHVPLNSTGSAVSEHDLPSTIRSTMRERTRGQEPTPRGSGHHAAALASMAEADLKWRGILPGYAGGSWLVEAWDLQITIICLIIAFFTPYSLCLYGPGEEPWWHAWANMFLLVCITLDIGLHFVTARALPQDGASKDLWMLDMWSLAKHYTDVPCSSDISRGWFWIDVLCVAPGWYVFFVHRKLSSNPLVMIRLIRICCSQARLHRLDKLTECAHARYGFPLNLLEVIKFVFLTTLTCHWIACAWVLFEGRVTQGAFSIRGVDHSWLSALIAAKGDACEPNAESDPGCVYLIAFYWAVMTLTTVGYGDITPQNKVEYGLSVVCMILVSYIWAYIVGSIVAILSDLDPAKREFRHNMDSLVGFMSRRGLPSDLQVRMRTYLYETRDLINKGTQKELVEHFFSDGLQRELMAKSLEAHILRKSVYWMRDLHEDVVMDITRSFRARGYDQNENIHLRGYLCFLQQGLVGLRGRLLTRGDVWGCNDVLVETPQLVDSAVAKTLKYAEVLSLSRPDLCEVTRKYPEADRRLRRAQIRTAVARAFVYLASTAKSRTKQMGTQMSLDDVGDVLAPLGAESSFSNPAAAGPWAYSHSAKQGEVQGDQIMACLQDLMKRQNELAGSLMELTKSVNQDRAAREQQAALAAREPALRHKLMGMGAAMLRSSTSSPSRPSTTAIAPAPVSPRPPPHDDS